MHPLPTSPHKILIYLLRSLAKLNAAFISFFALGALTSEPGDFQGEVIADKERAEVGWRLSRTAAAETGRAMELPKPGS
jgi:hypothetical protein